MVTDAADRGHKQHAGGHNRGEYLGVMTRAAGHADRPATGEGQACRFDRLLESDIHHGGSAGTKTLYRNSAPAVRANLCGHAPQLVLQAIDHAGVIVAYLE